MIPSVKVTSTQLQVQVRGVGVQGATGPDSANVLERALWQSGAIVWTFDGGLVAGDPGTGNVRMDAADPNDATSLYVSNVDVFGDEVYPVLHTLDDTFDGFFHAAVVFVQPASGAWATFRVNGAVEVGATYTRIPVLCVNGFGPFAVGERCGFNWAPTGDRAQSTLDAQQAATYAEQMRDEVATMKADFDPKYADFTPKYADFVPKYADFALKYPVTVQASTDAVAAAASAAVSAAALFGTSSTSLAIGTGLRDFTASLNRQWQAGQYLVAASDADPANYMHGQVVSYDGSTGELLIMVTDVGGSGTRSDWIISVSGTRGPVGAGQSYAVLPGETGVLDMAWPPGDVRRYGIVPDGVTNWEGSFPARVTAAFANSCLPRVIVYWPPGPYATGLNLGAGYVGSKMFFDQAEFYNILHVIDNVTDVQWLGTVYTYDRLGTIGSRLRFGTVVLLNDPAKNPQGTGNRGVHILGGEDISWDHILVQDTGPTSAVLPGAQTIWSAFTVQGNARNVRGKSVWVKNAQGHGAYINAYDVNIDLIKVDGYANQAINLAGALQDTDSEAQSEQGCGVWLNRWTGNIGRIVVGQSNAAPVADVYSVLIDETGKSTSAGDRYVTARIGSIRATVGEAGASTNRGVCIGEAMTPGVMLNLDVDEITAQLRTGKTMAAGYGMVNVLPPSTAAQSKYAVNVRHIDFVDSGAQVCLKATGASGGSVYTELNIGTLSNDYMQGAGQMCAIDGSAAVGSMRGGIGRVQLNYAAGSGANPIIDLNGTSGFNVQSAYLRAQAAVNTPAVRMLNCEDSAIRNLRSENFRNTGVGTVAINGGSRCVFGPAYIKGAAVTGQGVIFSNTINDLSLVDVRVTDFAVGFDNGAGLTMNNCSAINCRSFGNTDLTDLTTTNIPTTSQFNCTGVTA